MAFLSKSLWTKTITLMLKKGITIIFILFGFCALAQNKMTPEKLWQLNRISDQQVSPDGKMVLYGVTSYELSTNQSKRTLFIVPVQGGEARALSNIEGSAFNARWRPDGKKIGFLSAKSGSVQLWEINPDGTGLAQVSHYDFGISNFAYSPTMGHISFTSKVKLDQTVNELYPDLPLAEARIIDDLMYRHWDEWHDYHYSHVFIDGYQNGKSVGKPIDLMPGERHDTPLQPFGGTEDIAWSPDGKKLVYVSKKLTGKEFTLSTNSDLYLYDLEKRTTTNITEEFKGYDTHPVFSGDGTKIAWLSMERAGFEADQNVIFIYDIASGKKMPVTQEFDISVRDFIWGRQDRMVYFIAGTQATYQIYGLDLKTNRFDRIRIQPTDLAQVTQGTHDYNALALAGDVLVGSKTSMSMPQTIFRIDLRNGRETQLTFANKELLDNITPGKVEERMVKTTDNKDMLVWVIYPPDFDASKKYPTLLYCQGGPQSAVSQFFSYRWNFQLMAANDYIIVAPNRRGLPTFGQEWNDQISGDWGGQAMQDYLSAIDAVSKEPYVDQERLGAVGASYGGYSVYFLAGIHENRFKAFISHCGLFNLDSWYASTEEMFFANWDVGGPYWEEPKPVSYQKFSPHKFVGNWDTPILVIHGEKDFRVPINQGIEAFNAAQLQDIPSRFLYFPNEGHWVLQPQNGVLWHRVFYEWLDKYLKD
jgi:dipeptidyl aminopeptidase/acylaminoacyl peptidase